MANISLILLRLCLQRSSHIIIENKTLQNMESYSEKLCEMGTVFVKLRRKLWMER